MYQTTQPNRAVPERSDASTRERFIEKIQAQLDEWNVRVDRLAAKTESLSGSARKEAQERIRNLKTKLESARERLHASKVVRDEKWNEAKAALEGYWEELRSLFGAL